MNSWRVDIALMIATALVLALALVRFASAVPSKDLSPALVGAAPVIVGPPRIADLEGASAALSNTNPFRLSRSAAAVRLSRAPQAAVTPHSRATLALKGIVGGPPWQAIVDGIPGVPEGTVVRSGSVFDKYRIVSVTRDSVIVQGPDTTWRLTLSNRGIQ